MKLGDEDKKVNSRIEFVTFLQAFREDLKHNPEKWENGDLSSFLEAMAAWIEDMEGFYLNQNRPVPDQPTWNVLAEILLAARVYE